MKTNLLVFSFFLLISLTSFSQTFYIEKSENGFELPIIDKLLELDKKITAKQEVSDYTIKCMIEKTGMGRATCSAMIFNSKTGELIEKTKKVKGQTSIFNGYANPKMIAMKKIAEKYLESILKNLKKS